ncbi:hypothetical protein D9Q98_006951 [Chlorella vulgaris]|uniref:Uncharacterized protein n=1 Tax=Chlorella vulgaris TaxID=3077 RepID=A0A9D4YUK0_CHLVU|nr:hypothetical protein D9Q98_006951 [Chlorella vulgaris]
MLGVFARYLQVVTIPPFPMLRFTSTLNLLALPTLLICYSLPRRALHHRQARQARRAAVASGGTTTAEPGKGSLWTGDADCSNEPITAGPDCKPGDGEAGWLTGAGAVQVPGEKAALAAAAESAAAPAAVAAASSSSSWGPPLPGLARLRGRPKAHRAAVLLLCASCYEAAILGQNIAPRLVDPAVVMLVSMFTVVGVALLARFWLKAPLRWAVVVPAAAVMIGGAVMILVPDIVAGVGEPGSLTTGGAWLGFAASVGAMVGNTLFIVLAQAFKDTALSAIEVQYLIIWMNLLIVLPISLGVDGTDWAAQFGGMNGGDWGALLFCGCVAHAWIALLIQESTVRLGGTTVSMFFGFRLIASIVGGKVVLGVTIVQTAVQFVGVALMALAITTYTALQWRASTVVARRQAAAAAEG